MAKFVSLTRQLEMGLKNNLELDESIRKSPKKKLLGQKQDEDARSTEGANYEYDRVETEHYETFGELEEKKFWMNLIPPSKAEVDIVKNLKTKLKFVETIIAIVSFLSIVVTQVEYEFEYYPKMYDCDPKTENCKYDGQAARVIASFACLCLALMSIYCARLNYQIKKEQKKIITLSFWQSNYCFFMFVDVLIDLIHPIPYVDVDVQLILLGQKIEYKLMTFLYGLMFLKLYSVIRITAAYTSYSSNMSEKFCEMYGTEANTTFQLKAIQKDYPFIIVSLSFATCCVILGILIRMFEVLDVAGGGYDKYHFYTNGFWNIVVIMTTVGYGDFYPKTHVGRLIAIIAIVLGTLLVSLSIVSLNRSIQFDTKERQAYTILNRTVLRRQLNDTCQKIIKLNWEITQLKSQHKWVYKKILNDTEYTSMLRTLKQLSQNKLVLKRQLAKDTFFKTEEKFIALNERITNEIWDIKESFALIKDYRERIKRQIKVQKDVITNLDNNIKIIRENIKPAYISLFANAPGMLLPGNDLEEMGEPKDSNEMEREVEHNLFGKNKGNGSALLKSFLAGSIVKTIQENKNKESRDSEVMNDSYASLDNQKDPIKVEFEKTLNMDKKLKIYFRNTSQKTIDYLTSLNNLRSKNDDIFHKIKAASKDKDKDKEESPQISFSHNQNRMPRASVLRGFVDFSKPSFLNHLENKFNEKAEKSPVESGKKVNLERKEENVIKELDEVNFNI